MVTTVNVSPTATSCRNGERAYRAMRKPSHAYAANASVSTDEADEAPLLADVAGDEVVVAERQEAELLAPFAEAAPKNPPEPTAISDCHSW